MYVSMRCQRSAFVVLAIIVMLVSKQPCISQVDALKQRFRQGVPELEAPSIIGDFTLKYSAKQILANTPAAIAQRVRANTVGIDHMVESGTFTKEEGEERKKQVLQAIHSIPPQMFDVTLSYHNGVLLFKRSVLGNPHISIWDGKKTYFYDGGQNILYVTQGLKFNYFLNMPCPGAGLPGMPIIRLATAGVNRMQVHGDMYTDLAGRSQTEPLYLPGILTYQMSSRGLPKVANMEWRMGDMVNGRYEFTGEARLGNVVIAQSIRRLQFDPFLSRPPAKEPVLAMTTVYTLKYSSDHSLPDDQFLPETYLHAAPHDHPEQVGSHIKWETPDPPVFVEYHTGETLEEQRNKELRLLKQDDEARKKLVNKRSSVIGPVLLVVLVIIGIGSLIRRRRMSL